MPPWNVARLQEALASLGVQTSVIASPVRQPFMAVPGTLLQLSEGGQPRGTAQVYIYGDAVSRGHDTDRLDSVRVSPPAAQIRWEFPPALVTSNNLALVVLTSDRNLRDLARRAVAAPPRPVPDANGMPPGEVPGPPPARPGHPPH